MKPTARTVALEVLNAPPGGAFADELLDAAMRRANLPRLERKLASELVNGVLRRRGTLDALIAPFLNRPPAPELMNLVRLGAYQLALLDHVPAHAAIYTTVDLVPAKHAKLRGFVNAVLRGLTRVLTDTVVDSPADDAYPTTNGIYRRLQRPIFPDPQDDPHGYIAAGFSLPRWMVDRWLPSFGVQELHRLGFWFAGPAPIWLRVNPLKTNREKFMAELGVETEAGASPQSVKLLGPAAIAELPGYAAGHFCVQDHSSQEVAAMLNPEPGWKVLDRCAAPGGKSTHLAELMQDQGEVLACDVDAGKSAVVQTLTRRLGLKSIHTVTLQRDGAPPPGPFDAALVDAPCSNTGVLGRRAEVRWRLRPGDITELATLQLRLLLESVDRVRAKGLIVYSTCSIEPEENEAVVRAALAARPALKLESEFVAVPGKPSDGGYRARMRLAATR